jgi:replicative DNA helicase
MSTKLTLTLDNEIIKIAKSYAKENNISLSKLVEFYFKTLSSTSSTENYYKKIPPITKELSGLAKITTTKSDKKLLEDALNRRFL